jgi:hypothetical protein
MLTKFFPWKFFLKRLSKTHGFIDPFALLARFNRFAQPAERVAPYELLRAGAVMHARGLLNSQAIQHNLDWIWPFWVEEQFNPHSPSFIPRAFALTHINLTHRNWTATGTPGMRRLPIVDPRGLLTAIRDGWSIDFWILGEGSDHLLPSRCEQVSQFLTDSYPLQVITESSQNGHRLHVSVEAAVVEGCEACIVRIKALTLKPGARLILSLRPYNPEGVSLLESIAPLADGTGWRINRHYFCRFDERPDAWWYSCYRQGDVYHAICENKRSGISEGICDVGMASAAAEFRLVPEKSREIVTIVPLQETRKPPLQSFSPASEEQILAWRKHTGNLCEVRLPDDHDAFLYKNAVRTMALHAPDDILAGPYTYNRFWFRDAVLIAHAMLLCGLIETASTAIRRFSRRQTATGYFESQEGEWDSNGQVLWLYELLDRLGGKRIREEESRAIIRAATWLCRKRMKGKRDSPHQGLLPAGFSAEHLGPNDYYYWDDFWAVAGLRAAGRMMLLSGDRSRGLLFGREASSLAGAVDKSLSRLWPTSGTMIMPASPYRRPDSAAVGSLAAGYPLQLFEGRDPRLLDTAGYLFENCCVDNAFFHDVSHAGINPYLTLHLAQTFLRARDPRFVPCMEAIARLASPTGQWPEAVHPRLGTGCMGDGQHVWAAAEWVCMVRNCFVMEEYGRGTLNLCTGLLPRWLVPEESCSLGPTPTSFGPVTVTARRVNDNVDITWDGGWRGEAPKIEIAPVWGKTTSQTATSATVAMID